MMETNYDHYEIPLHQGPEIEKTPDAHQKKDRSPQKSPSSPKSSNLKRDRANDKKTNNCDSNASFHGGPKKRQGSRLARWSCLASFIDALVLVAASCVYILIFNWIQKKIFNSTVSPELKSRNDILFFVEIYFLLAWIYLISLRGQLGYTIGEWACDLRLGQDHERTRKGYLLRVALRSTLVLATGIIPLPLFSVIFGNDIPGALSGIRLFSLK